MDDYFFYLRIGIPNSILFISVIIIIVLILVSFIRGHGNIKYICSILLIEYIFLLVGSTLMFREPKRETTLLLNPLWPLEDEYVNYKGVWFEIILNIIAFIPFGFLLSCMFPKKYKYICVTGCILSILIETVQYFFKLGICETTDVICNILGCVLGCLAAYLFLKL